MKNFSHIVKWQSQIRGNIDVAQSNREKSDTIGTIVVISSFSIAQVSKILLKYLNIIQKVVCAVQFYSSLTSVSM